MRRALLGAALLLLLWPAAASAHPLGNFSVNHQARVAISADRIDVTYVLDQAEIPTFQERGRPPARELAAKRAEVERGLALTVGDRRVPLSMAAGGGISFPRGQGGLPTTRVTLRLSARVATVGRTVRIEDRTFPGRVGWKAIVAAPGEGTAVRTTTPTGDPTDGLRRYPTDLLESPLDRREANFSVTPGTGTLVAPREEGGRPTATSHPAGAATPGEGGPTGGGRVAGKRGTATGARSDGFAGLFEDAAAGRGVLVLLLLAAFGWGALHALSPGHGKAMAAAYLIGTRGTARDAVVLGATVTVTHTIGVFALGLVTLALSQYVLPEQLYPWLTLVSGVMVVAVGGTVLRSRLRRRSVHADGHAHGHGHGHRGVERGLLSLGAAAGLLPCPSALVVLLAAISQHEVALGMLLIVVFSLGLAGTLTALGLAVVHARRFVPPRIAASRLAVVLPALSAVFVVAIGLVLAAGAVPDVV
jgi:nickel/cobalt transporter (NicO) family protein